MLMGFISRRVVGGDVCLLDCWLRASRATSASRCFSVT
jgi:hypothetical protein